MKNLIKTDGPFDLAAAFDASPNPYLLLTPDFTIAGVNQAYLDVTHSTREAIVGQPLFAAFDSGPGDEAPDNVRQVRASLERARDGRQRDHLAMVRFSIPRRDGNGGEVFEDRIWSATHTPILNEAGELTYILQHTSDITELHRLRESRSGSESGGDAIDSVLGGAVLLRAEQVQEDNQRLQDERNRLVDMFMQTPGFVAVLSGPDHVFQFYNEAYHRLIGYREIEGLTVVEAMPDVVEQGYIRLLDSVFETGKSVQGHASLFRTVRHPGGPVEDAYVDFIYQPIRDGEGKVIGVFVQGHDVTDAVEAGQRQKLMIDELNHRVKNTLATVQSIAMQTARSHTDPATFAEGFQARLMALSHTHDLLTRSYWEGAELRAILQHETEAHGAHRISVTGPAMPLEPATALSVGMIFHELATNAAKYGALSTPDGRVQVDWTIAREGAGRLDLTWREIGGPPVVPPARKGFGSRLIERNVRHDLAGSVELDYAGDGFVATFSIPLSREQGV